MFSLQSNSTVDMLCNIFKHFLIKTHGSIAILWIVLIIQHNFTIF